ncbi:NACHT nucleoside triphosphatase [Penicillium herquei]|nr:NACHT nucleoside triphosphatase [Penicillium herquei]
MDGVSTAASVIAVIQLATSITKICGGYIQGVKDASDEIESLQRRAADLRVSLEKLSELRQKFGGDNVPTSQTLVDDAKRCLTALEKRYSQGPSGKL